MGKVIIQPSVSTSLGDKNQKSSSPNVQIQYGWTRLGNQDSDLILSRGWLGNH